MTYSQATLEAICEMGQGRPEYNRGVLACTGKLDIWNAWNFARVTAESASEALQRQLTSKHGDDDLAKMLDSENTPESAALTEANARLAQTWTPIQAVIDAAREALHRG